MLMMLCKHQGRKAGRTGVRWTEKGRKPLCTPASGPKGFTVFALGLPELQGSRQRGSSGEAVNSLQT